MHTYLWLFQILILQGFFYFYWVSLRSVKCCSHLFLSGSSNLASNEWSSQVANMCRSAAVARFTNGSWSGWENTLQFVLGREIKVETFQGKNLWVLNTLLKDICYGRRVTLINNLKLIKNLDLSTAAQLWYYMLH